MQTLVLPRIDGSLEKYAVQPSREFETLTAASFGQAARTFYSAAHVVANPLADINPWQEGAIDWDATLAFRERLYGLGLGVAEAMDTAQRGMGLDWAGALELIKKSVSHAIATGHRSQIICGASTDQLASARDVSIESVINAYEEQCAAIEEAGARIVLMSSRALAACARGEDDYTHVYDRILSQVREPVVIHWLGECFDPALHGYWGSENIDAAMETALRIIQAHPKKVDGVKISLLDADKERAMRARLPNHVRMYTGDDFNYPELIAESDGQYSHALLGIFAAISKAASAGLKALTDGNVQKFEEILNPTVPLSKHIFKAPTRFYKTGVVFMAYLNGYQDHFSLLGGQQSARSAVHLAELFRLADAAGVLEDPDLAARRIAVVMSTFGIDNS